MFTGIVEKMVEVKSIIASKNNLIMEIYFENIHELRVDQSISHNGACLTVTKLNDNSYQVDLIEETIKRTNFKLRGFIIFYYYIFSRKNFKASSI